MTVITKVRGQRGWALNAHLVLPPSRLEPGDKVKIFYAGPAKERPYCAVYFSYGDV